MSSDPPRAGVPPHDLWTGGGRQYLLPAGVRLPPGPLVLRTLTGEEQHVDPAVAAPFEISTEEAEQFTRELVEQTATRVAEVLQGFAAVFREVAAPDPEGGSPPGATALHGLLQFAMGVARGDVPERLRPASQRVADRLRETDADLAAALEQFPDRLAEEIKRRKLGEGS